MALVIDRIRPAMASRLADQALPAPPSRIKEENYEEIQSYKPPTYTPPYPTKRNPLAASIPTMCRAWFQQHQLQTVFSDPNSWLLMMACQLYDMPTWVFVEAEEEELLWVCNFVLWLFVLDDLLDEHKYTFYSLENSASLFVELNLLIMWTFPDVPAIRDIFAQIVSLFPEEQRQPAVEYVEAKLAEARSLPGTLYDAAQIGPIGVSFMDLWEKLLRSTPTDSVIRWAVTMQRFFLGNASEARNRSRQTIPSVAEYIAIRRNVSAVGPCIVIVDYMDKVSSSLPSVLFDSPEMKEMLEAANDVLSWHNDIWSVKKEMENGEVHNLVFVISHERGCSLSEAGNIVVDMMYSRLQDLARAIADLERITPPEHQQAISGYTKATKLWVSGTHEFHIVNNHFT